MYAIFSNQKFKMSSKTVNSFGLIFSVNFKFFIIVFISTGIFRCQTGCVNISFQIILFFVFKIP